MAKNNLPSVDDFYKGPTVDKPTELPPPPPSKIETEGYLSTHMIDINRRADTKLTRDQAMELRSKMRRLQDEDCVLMDGSAIRSKSDVIRWMIENPLAPRPPR